MSLWIVIASFVCYLIGAFMLFSIVVHLEEGEDNPTPIWAILLVSMAWPLVVLVCLVAALAIRFGWRKT